MTVTIEVKSEHSTETAKRKTAANRVLEELGKELPDLKLLAFFDDCDWHDFKRELGHQNRGFYAPIKTDTFRGWIWPSYVTSKIFVSELWPVENDRFVDHVIYLYGSTCLSEVGLIMTFAHELQHFIQYGSKRKLWAEGQLIPRLPKELVESIGLNWPDIPHEREARIVEKRVAVKLCGTEAVKEYTDQRIEDGSSVQEVEDWQFRQQLDPSSPYDLEGETRLVFQRLRPHRQSLENVLRDMNCDADFRDLDLSTYFDGE
jgi:hypothetical protein